MSEHTDAPLELVPRHPVGRGSELTCLEREDIRLAYLVEGLNISAISRKTGRTRETVAAVLRDQETKRLEAELVQERRARAKATLSASSEVAAEAWVDTLRVAAKKGDHRPARDLLMHEEVIKPITPHGNGSVTIQIGVSTDQLVLSLNRQETDELGVLPAVGAPRQRES